MKKKALSSLVVLVLSVVLTLGFVFLKEEKNSPTSALEKFNADLRKAMIKKGVIKEYEEFLAMRKEIATDILTTVQTEDISDEERLALSELLDYARRSDEALAAAKAVAKGTGLVAQKGTIKYIELLADAKRFDDMEPVITDYHSRFKPTPELVGNLSGPLEALAGHYQENGEYEKVVRIVMAEINSLDDSAPFASYSLLGDFSESFINTGKKEQLQELCGSLGEKFNAIVEARKKDPKAEEKEFSTATRQYASTAKRLNNAHTRLALVGEQAPDFNFSHYYNSEPVSLKDLKGKVVMIDFWATWCGPCKAAFPHMRSLYDQYKDQGFVIISVTSFQGRYSDGDVRESKISEAREVELTADFVKNHKMTWPVAFSDRSCFDPEYGVSSIPTFTLIGRDGTVKHIGVGSGEETEKSLNEWVPKLLAEEE